MANGKVERRKIIIVDDIMFHLLSIKERLKEHYMVFPAQTADMMFYHLSKVKPELIILDINMPNNDGYKTIEMLKLDSRYSDIPVIFLTGQKDRESLNKAMELGAADYLMKPVTDTELIECIEYQLNPTSPLAMRPVVLAVDDNPSILKSINSFLRERYNVSTLPDSTKIRDLLSVITPDLFILDCNMPGLNGFDLIPIIRDYPGFKDTPIIFLTGEGTMDNFSEAMELGASDFLVKPIDGDKIREKAEEHLKDFVLRRRLCKIAQVL